MLSGAFGGRADGEGSKAALAKHGASVLAQSQAVRAISSVVITTTGGEEGSDGCEGGGGSISPSGDDVSSEGEGAADGERLAVEGLGRGGKPSRLRRRHAVAPPVRRGPDNAQKGAILAGKVDV